MRTLALASLVLALLSPRDPGTCSDPSLMEVRLEQALNRFAFEVYRPVASGDENAASRP